MVIVIGNHDSSVRYHIEGVIRAGATVTEVKELLLQMMVYAGYPKMSTALPVALKAEAELQQRGMPAASP